MAAIPVDRLLSQLEEARYRFGAGEGARMVKLLALFDRAQLRDPAALMRFHEALLFVRAFPQSAAVARKAESCLDDFWKRVAALRTAGESLASWDTFESAGVSSTIMEDTLGFDVARWLIRALPAKVEIAWDNFEAGREAATIMPRLVPLLADDASVEADTPWQKYIVAAKGRQTGAEWLLQRIEAMPLSEGARAELYDSLRVPLRWELDNTRLTRTRNAWRVSGQGVRDAFSGRRQALYCHKEPLMGRSQVALAEELAKEAPGFVRLPRSQGERVLESIREVMLVRYRELYGTTLGDPASVVRADLGRGLSIYLWNLPPHRRLPLRSYVAGFSFKNGVPVNYIEAIGLCEWMEVGFNTFYTFRGGETAWIYAQVLRCLCHLMGTTCISVYPYQLGHENDEAIESGAFWFYRKLGFRPGRPDLLRLVRNEERKIAAHAKYRTPARTLRRLAASHVFYELPGSEVGAWDRFSTRNIGLRVNARMARSFGGDAARMRRESARSLAGMCGADTPSWTALEKLSLENFAVALAPAGKLSTWSREDRASLIQIIRSKAARNEMTFLRLTQRHPRLREALLKLGS